MNNWDMLLLRKPRQLWLDLLSGIWISKWSSQFPVNVTCTSLKQFGDGFGHITGSSLLRRNFILAYFERSKQSHSSCFLIVNRIVFFLLFCYCYMTTTATSLFEKSCSVWWHIVHAALLPMATPYLLHHTPPPVYSTSSCTLIINTLHCFSKSLLKYLTGAIYIVQLFIINETPFQRAFLTYAKLHLMILSLDTQS